MGGRPVLGLQQPRHGCKICPKYVNVLETSCKAALGILGGDLEMGEHPTVSPQEEQIYCAVPVSTTGSIVTGCPHSQGTPTHRSSSGVHHARYPGNGAAEPVVVLKGTRKPALTRPNLLVPQNLTRTSVRIRLEKQDPNDARLAESSAVAVR